jgi:predicted molibdopterin-dependent oxidoreductase YjgC
MLLQVLDGVVIGVLPSKTHLVNQGALCIKGWNAHEFIYSEKRLSKPLVRDGGDLKECTWEEAIDHVASRFMKIKEESGPDSIAALSSAKCTNEENYLMQKFMRAVVGTNNVDHCARL